MCHIFRRETDECQTWYRDEVRWYITDVRGDVSGQRSRYVSLMYVCPLTRRNEKSRKHQDRQEGCQATVDIPHQFQCQKDQRSRSPCRSGWLFKSPLAGGGAYCDGSTTDRAQGRSDGGISVYIPPKSVYLKKIMWLFFSCDSGQIPSYVHVWDINICFEIAMNS